MWRKISEEKKWIIQFAVVVMLVTLIPYWIGFSRQGADWSFTGFVFGVEDGNSYIAKMLSGVSGHWLFQSPYTAYPQKGALAFLPYLLLGKLSAPPEAHIQLVVLYHVFRMLSGFLMILATYDFISVYISGENLRRLGTAIATLGGGLGWLSVFGLRGLWQNGLPLEFYSPETFGFLALFGLPHLAMARAFLLWGLTHFLSPGDEMHSGRSGVIGGLFWLGMSFFQPLTVVVGWAILGVYQMLLGLSGIVRIKNNRPFDWTIWRLSLKRVFSMVCISSPVAIYSFFAFSLDPFLQQWTGQNLILSPPIEDYLLAFGLMLPPAVLGLKGLLRRKPFEAWLVIGWVASFPFLAYAPYNLQRRLPEGVWAALAVIALSSLETMENRNHQKWLKGVLYSSFLTTLLVYLGAIITVWQPCTPLYRPKEEAKMFNFLAERASDREVVLASYGTSNALPAWAPVKTLIGHGPESVNLAAVQEQVEQFFQPDTNEAFRREVIQEFDVKYVIWGPSEQALEKYDPDHAAFLEEIYDLDGYRVFEVNMGDE